jgi:hypothetical protein
MSGVVGLPQAGHAEPSRDPQFEQNFWSALAGAPQLEQFKPTLCCWVEAD